MSEGHVSSTFELVILDLVTISILFLWINFLSLPLSSLAQQGTLPQNYIFLFPIAWQAITHASLLKQRQDNRVSYRHADVKVAPKAPQGNRNVLNLITKLCHQAIAHNDRKRPQTFHVKSDAGGRCSAQPPMPFVSVIFLIISGHAWRHLAAWPCLARSRLFFCWALLLDAGCDYS